MSEAEIKNLRDGTEYMAEAARLHLRLKDNATEEAVVQALVWRFGLDKWDAEHVYKQSLVMLDAIKNIKKP